MLSVIYITSRIQPHIEWFIDSLWNQTTEKERSEKIELIFIDRLMDAPDTGLRANHFKEAVAGRFRFQHVAPKPNSYQGSHRVTREDFFAAANARNTGVAYANGDYLCFVDDVSVATGQWWTALKEAYWSEKITLGAYRKVRELRVEKGNITWHSHFDGGEDSRWKHGSDSAPVDCRGEWLYGCSFALPLHVMLEVNGSDEASDGMGFEDCLLGVRLENRGHKFQYDRRMLTFESEEAHHLDKIMRREDKGISPNDKSHAILKIAQATNRAENAHFGPEGISGLREVLRAKGFIPFSGMPTHDWYDGQPLAEL